MERKLASVRKIDNLFPIEGADLIECAQIGGWQVVVKKNEFKVGELVIYIEIDSWIPTEMAPFLSKGKEPKVYLGVKGERLRTIRLRKQISQGLILPLNASLKDEDGNDGLFLPCYDDSVFDPANSVSYMPVEEDMDLTEWMQIQKWEQQVPACLAGIAKGNFPTNRIRKTDQERVQNLTREIEKNQGEQFEVSVKLDGSSLTVYVDGEKSGVCSRNLNLEQTDDNLFWKTAIKNDLINAIKSTGRNLAIQSEMIGLGIQGNPENLTDVDSYVFDIFDIDTYSYLPPAERTAIVKQMNDNGFVNVKQVPILGFVTLDKNVAQLLEMADGASLNAPNREGIVYKRLDGQFSFKAISNWYLETYPNR